MDTIRDLADGWIFLRENLSLVEDEDERGKYLARLDSMIPKFLDALEARLSTTVVKAAVAVAAAPVERVLQDDYSYDEFAELFEKYNRNVADSLRVWFKDFEGGFDTSNASDRVLIYSKASDYLAEKARTTSPARNTPSGNGKPYVKQGGGSYGPAKVGPCPDCGADKIVTTKYGDKYRCDDHNWWGKV